VTKSDTVKIYYTAVLLYDVKIKLNLCNYNDVELE